MAKELIKKEVVESVEEYSIKDVPTAFEGLICDSEKAYTDREILLLILNKLSNMEQKIVG